MTSPVVHLPEAQLRPLLASYDAAVRSRRFHSLITIACIVAAIALSSISAEVSLGKLFANIGNFTSYFSRLTHLESGAYVWTDPVEWYWGLGRWLRLLGETLMMAYVGTALGAQAGEAKLREVISKGGFTRVRRAAETPFNMILEARP